MAKFQVFLGDVIFPDSPPQTYWRAQSAPHPRPSPHGGFYKPEAFRDAIF